MYGAFFLNTVYYLSLDRVYYSKPVENYGNECCAEKKPLDEVIAAVVYVLSDNIIFASFFFRSLYLWICEAAATNKIVLNWNWIAWICCQGMHSLSRNDLLFWVGCCSCITNNDGLNIKFPFHHQMATLCFLW